MHVISKRTLAEFWEKNPYSKKALINMFEAIREADWDGPEDVKKQFRSVSFVGNNRLIFNINGNSYRLIVKINYKCKVVFIRFVGTHEQYNKVNAEVI